MVTVPYLILVPDNQKPSFAITLYIMEPRIVPDGTHYSSFLPMNFEKIKSPMKTQLFLLSFYYERLDGAGLNFINYCSG